MIVPARMTDCHSGPLVVFIIGMRINHLHRPDQWLPVARAMGPMIAELSRDPASGFMGAEVLRQRLRTICLIQYWRDFDALESYAQNRERAHWPAWTAFNKAIGTSGKVGIFHETYCVPAGGHETICVNMPAFGLARATGSQPASGNRAQARSRMQSTLKDQ